MIDGAAINGLLFSTLASTIELYNTGELFGRPNWSYVLSKGNIFRMFWMALALRVGSFFMRWIILPAVAVGLGATGYETWAGIVIGLWLLYLLYRAVMVPARWRSRKALRKKEEIASQTIATIMKAWQCSNGTVINPSRLKELVLASEQQHAATFKLDLLLAADEHRATFKPVLHTLIDRAIQRDPTALLTKRQSTLS